MCLESHDGLKIDCRHVPNLFSSQEEADTRIILHCLYASQSAEADTNIIVRTPDTDVLVILLSYSDCIAQPLFMDTGAGNKRRLINIHGIAEAIGLDLAKSLPGLHAFTGSDCTSSFVKKGKVKPFKVLQEHPNFMPVFQRLGSSPDFDSDCDLQELQRFVCCMYGKPSYFESNKLRLDMFKARCEAKSVNKSFSIHNGIDLSLLPPCLSSLQLHCSRVNYQAFIWRHSHHANVDIPTPVRRGWKLDHGDLCIEWTCENVLLQQLMDVLASSEEDPGTPLAASLQENEHEPNESESQEDDEMDSIIDIIFDDGQDD